MTNYHRHCASSPTQRCQRKPECDGPCHFDNAELNEGRGPVGWHGMREDPERSRNPDAWRGQNLPITMKSNWRDTAMNFVFTLVEWSFVIAVVVLTAIGAYFLVAGVL